MSYVITPRDARMLCAAHGRTLADAVIDEPACMLADGMYLRDVLVGWLEG